MQTSHFRNALDAQRAEALYLSPLSTNGRYTQDQVLLAVRETTKAHGGQAQTCADCAAEYCVHACETGEQYAIERMRWALAVAAGLTLTAVQLAPASLGAIA